MPSCDAIQPLLRHQPPEILVAQIAGRSLRAQVLDFGMLRHVPAAAMQLQFVMPCQLRDKTLIRIGFRPAQIVVEVNDREHDADFLAKLEQQSKQRNRIGSARDRDPGTIPGTKKPLPPDVLKNALSQLAHAQCYIRAITTARVGQRPGCPVEQSSTEIFSTRSSHHPIQIRVRDRSLKSLVRSRALQLLRNAPRQPHRRPHRARTHGYPRHPDLFQLRNRRRARPNQNVDWTAQILHQPRDGCHVLQPGTNTQSAPASRYAANRFSAAS